MGIALYINVRDRLFVTGITQPLPYKFPPMVQGDGAEYDIYFVTPTGNPSAPFAYENNTGAALRLGLTLPASRAASGTFTLTFNGQTTSALAYNAAAAVVKAALEALSNIGSGNVNVIGNDGGPWKILFQGALANTDVALITGAGALLFPESFSVLSQVLQDGGSGNNETQWIRLSRDALAENTSWTVGSSPGYAFSGKLDLNRAAIDALVEGAAKGTATLEIEIIRPGKSPDTLILQAQDIMNDGLENAVGTSRPPGGAFLLARAQPVLLTVTAGQNQSADVVVPYLAAADVVVAAVVTADVQVSQFVKTIQNDDPTQSKLAVQIQGTAPAGGAVIYALIFLNP